MRARVDLPEPLLRLAHAQAGAVTREQAVALGLPASGPQRLVAQGHWRRLGDGVYALSPMEPGWLTLAWAGILLGGDHACLGGAAAAHLDGLAPARLPIEVLIPHGARVPRSSGSWIFRRTRLPVRPVGSPPRTSVEQTVLDRCAEPGLALERIVGLVTDAVQQRRTQEQRLRRALAERARHPRRRELEELLGEVREGVRSPLERHYLRDVERAHQLPTAARQIKRRGTETDILYPGARLLVELDGRIGHTGSGKFRDMRRDNGALSRDQLVTLRYGYHDVRGDPCGVAAEVATVLRDRGWTGWPAVCPGCPRPFE